jgi:hypothetical protein
LLTFTVGPEGLRAMARSKFKVGDKVKVIGMSKVTFAPGIKDELGTERLFKSMIGKVYAVRGLTDTGTSNFSRKDGISSGLNRNF